LAGSYKTGENVFAVAVGSSYAYIADFYDGLRIIDMSTLSSLTEVGFLNPRLGWAFNIAVKRQLCSISWINYSGLQIV